MPITVPANARTRRMPTHRGILAVALAALAVAAMACGEMSDTTAPLVAPAGPSFDKKSTSPTKFTFTGVTLVDADGTTITDAIIYATTKQTGNSSGTTVCSYETADNLVSLGQFEAAEFTSAEQVEAFCIEQFANRQLR